MTTAKFLAYVTLIEPNIRYIVSHAESLWDATVRGRVLLFCQLGTVDEIAKRELKMIPVTTSEYDAPTTALWPASRNLSPRVDKLNTELNKETARIRL